jgi:small basic protein (TIGR04137 family)
MVQIPSLAGEVLAGGQFTFNFMAQHSSLRGASALGAKRNVLKRFERVAVLKRRGQWKEGDRVVGLRKTKPDA